MTTVLHVMSAGGHGREQIGGAERAVADLSGKLAERGWNVHVAAPRWYLEATALSPSVRPWAVEIGPRHLPELHRLIRRIRPDVLLAHLLRGSLLAAPAALGVGVPARLNILHNSLTQTFTTEPPSWARRVAYRVAFWSVTSLLYDATVAISPDNARDLRDRDRIREKQIRLIPNWFPPEFRFDQASRWRQEVRDELEIGDRRLVGFIGRLEEQKRPLAAIELLPRLAPDVALAVVGDGELRAACQRRAAQLGVSERVTFAGRRNDAERWLSAFDVLLVPSLFEGFGRVAVEALALGVPVVASDIPSLRFVLEGLTPPGAQLVAIDDAAGWAAAVDAALSPADPDRMRRELVDAAKRRFTLDAAVSRYVELIETTLASRA